ncbi:MAG: DNA-directed RNA polymerase subunit omega [Clostridia bacterium]|nr:DNA-directed RNA polymerase subunit omega [Clostridia bacterium]
MNQPSLEKLVKTTGNKYSLVVIAAKRARQITEAQTNKEELIKPVTQALYEIAEGKIKYRMSQGGIK